MDQLPSDFSERVAALWKCCESGYAFHSAECLDDYVADCEWTMKSKKQRIEFFISHDNDEWSHCFTNPDHSRGVKELLSVDKLKNYPNLKNVTIERIGVTEANTTSSMSPLRSREEIERLINLVVFLSNEPRLELSTLNVQVFGSPKGRTLFNTLSKMTFSFFSAACDHPVYNRILENQFLRRRPTGMKIQLRDNSEFFIEHLGNGNIQRLTGPCNFRFRAEVMERIIDRFLENPENYDKKDFLIEAEFEESAKEMLERKLKEERCSKVVYSTDSMEYRFTVNNPKLKRNSFMRILFSPHSGIRFLLY